MFVLFIFVVNISSTHYERATCTPRRVTQPMLQASSRGSHMTVPFSQPSTPTARRLLVRPPRHSDVWITLPAVSQKPNMRADKRSCVKPALKRSLKRAWRNEVNFSAFLPPLNCRFNSTVALIVAQHFGPHLCLSQTFPCGNCAGGSASMFDDELFYDRHKSLRIYDCAMSCWE